MQARDLQERVTFDAPSFDDDGVQDGWTDGALTCAAHFRYLRGGETVQAERLRGTQVLVVTIRRNSVADGITAEWKMRDARRGTVFNITAPPVPTEDRAWLEITATSGVAV